MAEQTESALQDAMRRVEQLLTPYLHPPRPGHEVIAPYGVIDTCGHLYASDGAEFVEDAAELADLMACNNERRARVVSRSPHRAGERSPGCSMCGVEKACATRGEPLHWRMN